MQAGFACGSMVLLFSFSRKVGSRSQLFGKKNGWFRPAGGKIPFPVSNRVTCVNNTTYAVRIQMGRLLPMMVYFACGSVVRFVFFRKIWHNVPGFPEKEFSIPPCRRRIVPVVQADVWFGTDRVTPVNNTTYAVNIQTSRLVSMEAGFACASMVLFFLLHKKVALCATFL